MLSNATLERVGVAYRNGYNDGYNKKEKFCEVKPEFILPFAKGDYENGYAAGENDRKWFERDMEKQNDKK